MKKDGVRAVIELRITPQRDCGFGKIAERVAKFEQVEACFLMSGGYDLLVFVKGRTRRAASSTTLVTAGWRFRDGGRPCTEGAEFHEPRPPGP